MTLEAGTHLGPYEIVAPLGAGGMGEVYRANDTRLDREVAIKVLPERLAGDPEALARFEREAKALAALSHPNILAIYDLGTDQGVSFVVMELLEGETLRERLRGSAVPWGKALEIGAAIADGLAAAHAKGVIHRDLKPENIFVTSDGVVKILDFGLAHRTSPASSAQAADSPTITLETSPGTLLGTAAYMSPEQVRSETTDARSDVFSLGCVLHEMVSGSRTFACKTVAETLAAILKEEPSEIAETGSQIPPELDQLIRHCLEKKPEERFQSARDLAFNLRAIESVRPSRSRALPWVGVAGMLTLALAVLLFVLDPGGWREQPPGEAAGERIESLAILPFVNESGDPDAEFLADGIAENLINNLLTMPELRVIPRNTAFRHKGREHELDQVASELKVRAVLTGRMHKQGDRLIVRAMLEDVQRDTQLWGERYEKDLSDILTIERDITRDISDALRLRLSSRDLARRDKRYTDNPQAHMAYVEGRFWWNKRTADGFRRALDLFDRAIAIDPEYALAYAGKAGTYSIMGFYTHRPAEVAPLAREAAETAIQLDPTLAEAYPPLGWVHVMYDWDWEAAEKAFRKAIELDPRYATAHHWYAMFLVVLGRFDEAEREITRARELDPGSLIINRDYAIVAFSHRDFDLALRRCRNAVEMDPRFAPTHMLLGDIYLSLKRYDEAIAEFRTILELEGRVPRHAWLLGYAYGLAGRRDEALEELRILTELSAQGKYVPAGAVGMIHAGLGDFDSAFEGLNKACDEHDANLLFIKFAPTVDPLRCDPRFDKLLARLKFPSYPPAPVVDPWPTIKPCLAVLPFEGPSTDTLYLKEEIPASIIHSLSNLSGLQVVPRSTAFRYQVRDQDTAAIGRDLGATAVLTGQVNAYGGALTIRAELVDVATKRQLWNERYDRRLADILTIEEDIARQISDALRLRLTHEDKARLTERYTENAEAYRAYMQGRFWWNKRTKEGFRKAIEFFDEAIRIDPTYALAYAGKAGTYSVMGYWTRRPAEVAPLTREAAKTAIRLDPTLAEAYPPLGWVHGMNERDWEAAARDYRKAIELNPRYATAHHWYAILLIALGRFDEAEREIDRARELDPGSLIINRDYASVALFQRDFDLALRRCRHAVEMDPTFAPTRIILGDIYISLKRYDEAIAEFSRAVELEGRAPRYAGLLGWAYGLAGRRAEALEELRILTDLSAQGEYVPAYAFGMIHAGLGSFDLAFQWFDKACDERDNDLVLFKFAPTVDVLRSDPRFDVLVARLNMPPDPPAPVVEPWPAATSPAGKIMLAVLPFEDMSPEPQEWFSDGITEEMISQLGRVRPDKLGVIARTSAMHYKSTTKPAAQIGRELGVDYLVEGSVRRAETSLRITAKLIQVSDQTQLWAEDFDRTTADVLAIQSDVAQRVARALAVELLPSERARLAVRRKVNPEAHEAYLRGRYYWNKRTEEGFYKAIECFDRAIKEDPGYAPAHAGLADSHILLAVWGIVPPREAFPKAKAAALKALQIDDTLAEAHTSLAVMQAFEWKWAQAEKEFRRAIALNPGYATAHQWYALTLSSLGRHAEAIAEAQRGLECDPLSLIIKTDVGSVYYFARQYDKSIVACRETLEMDPSFKTTYANLAGAYVQKGMYTQAIAAAERAVELSNAATYYVAWLGHIYAVAGKDEQARTVLNGLIETSRRTYVLPSSVAMIYADLGESDQAFEWLEKAYAQRDMYLGFINVQPFYDPLRGDPRFDDLLRRIGFGPESKPQSSAQPPAGRIMLAVVVGRAAARDEFAIRLISGPPRRAGAESLQEVGPAGCN